MATGAKFMIIPIFMILTICIPILIGVYVYRDARRRKMNAALWTLVAILAPSLIGFIIYLVVRGNSDMQCPGCGVMVEDTYAVCPLCGARLKAACSNCRAPINSGWRVCPHCAHRLDDVHDDITPPVKRKDKALGKILLAVIIIPVIIIFILVISFSAVTVAGSAMNTTYFEKEQYIDARCAGDIEAWIRQCDEEGGEAYALRYREDDKTCYLVYIPGEADMGISTSQTGRSVKASFTEGSGEFNLCTVSVYTDSRIGLKVYLNGARIACKVSDIDRNPALFDITDSSSSNAELYDFEYDAQVIG